MLRGKRWSTDCCVLDWIKITEFLSALCSTVVQQASRCFACWVRRATAACKFCRHRSRCTQYKTMISRFSLLAKFVLAGNNKVFSLNSTTKVNNSHKLQGRKQIIHCKWNESPPFRSFTPWKKKKKKRLLAKHFQNVPQLSLWPSASGITLASLYLRHVVACCKIRGWNIICIARKKIRYKSMLLFLFSHSRSHELPDSAVPDTPQILARLSCRACTADIDDWHTITARDFLFFFSSFFLSFNFTLRHRSRATLRANRGRAAGRTSELEGRKQEGVTDLTESVCLKCKQSGAHTGC